MWYICYDKVTDEPRRVIQLATQEKADAIKKYRVSEPYIKIPLVDIIPEVADAPKTEKEKALETLGLTQSDLDNIKKSASQVRCDQLRKDFVTGLASVQSEENKAAVIKAFESSLAACK